MDNRLAYNRLSYKGALKMAEKIVGLARSSEEKIVISKEAIVKEIATLNNKEE